MGHFEGFTMSWTQKTTQLQFNLSIWLIFFHYKKNDKIGVKYWKIMLMFNICHKGYELLLNGAWPDHFWIHPSKWRFFKSIRWKLIFYITPVQFNMYQMLLVKSLGPIFFLKRRIEKNRCFLLISTSLFQLAFQKDYRNKNINLPCLNLWTDLTWTLLSKIGMMPLHIEYKT